MRGFRGGCATGCVRGPGGGRGISRRPAVRQTHGAHVAPYRPCPNRTAPHRTALYCNRRYRGIVVGWDVQCCESDAWVRQTGASQLPRGTKQPFYHVGVTHLHGGGAVQLVYRSTTMPMLLHCAGWQARCRAVFVPRMHAPRACTYAGMAACVRAGGQACRCGAMRVQESFHQYT